MEDARERTASSRFACDDAQRACFEAGIKMATIYHQFVGTPFCNNNVRELESAIRGCILVQPYVEDASVRIEGDFGDKGDQYSYASLTGDMIDASVTVRVGKSRVTARMRYDEELGYPLMYVERVE